MTESKIRLRYSGLILFLARLVSIVTGLIYTLLVTRSLLPRDYGVYGNLLDIMFYFASVSSMIPFWVTRFEARRWPGSFKTGFVVNSLIGLVSAALYLFSIADIMRALQICPSYMPAYFIAVVLIFESYILPVLEATLYARRPEKIGFGLLVHEVSKVALVIPLIYILRTGLIGALAALIFAYLCQILFYIMLLLNGFREKIIWSYAKEWFKASILNVYGILGGRILAVANILLFIYGGSLSRAYYGVSSAVASLVAYSSSLAFALYPKLLAGAKSDDIVLSLRMVLMFAVPMLLGAIVLSEDLLSILNPAYSVASPILIILALSSFFTSLSSIFESIIAGVEDFDAVTKISFRRAFKSNLFLLLTLQYIQAAITLPPIYLALSLLSESLLSTFYFALISCIGEFVIMIIRLFIARRSIPFIMPWASLKKYICSSLIMAACLFILPKLPRLMAVLSYAVLGAIIYFAILFAIDKEFREMVKLAGREVKKIFTLEKVIM